MNKLAEYCEFRIQKLEEARKQYEAQMQILITDIQTIDQEIKLLSAVYEENSAY